MKKEFGRWNERKIQLNDADGTALFHEREVWWCALGANIGFEQDGGNADFQRPVIVVKKFNLDACLVVPLTARPKKGKYYFPVGSVDGRDAVAVLSQVRFIDRKRLVNKICTLETETFQSLLRAVIGASFNVVPLK
jgi:mRNA interferase MazF